MPRKPGHQLSEAGRDRANEAFRNTGWTQDRLAAEVGDKHDCSLTRQVISRFFKGESIDRQNFVWICEELNLTVDEVAAPLAASKAESQKPPSPNSESASAPVSVNPGRSAPVSRNPFGVVGRITNPDDFCDRQELLRRIFEELGKGSNISLVGEAQIGKSSILEMICQLGSQRLPLPPESFKYLDMQCIHNENKFFEALCDELGIETCRGYRLRRALQGKRYILCLDEIEKMNRQEHFTGDERTELRGLAGTADSPLTLVIASRSPLAELFPDSPEKTSPLDYPAIDVGKFSPEIARDFLQYRLSGTGVIFSEEQIRQILAETRGHPARLQQAAADLYRRLTSTGLTQNIQI